MKLIYERGNKNQPLSFTFEVVPALRRCPSLHESGPANTNTRDKTFHEINQFNTYNNMISNEITQTFDAK